jgi:DNA-binding transcriptional LysR family regulator
MPARITLSQLEAFRSVASTLSYTRAAEALGYSESAVYQQVHALERALGLKLFSVSRHRLQITIIGSQLAQLADETVTRVHEFERLAEVLGQHQREQITLTGAGVTSSFLLRHVLNDLRGKHPDPPITLHVGMHDLIVPGLLDGRYQIGVLAASPGDESFQPEPPREILVRRWLVDEWMLVRALEPEGDPRQALEQPRTIYYASHYAKSEPALEALLAQVTFGRPVQRVALEAVQAVKSAAMGHLGDAFLPGMSVLDEFALGLLERVPLPGIPRHLFAMRRRQAPSAVRRVFGSLLAWGSAKRGVVVRSDEATIAMP